jgi:flagellar hook-associated protein 1 FlgK
MSLLSSLRIATSGLAATQAGMNVVGQNVANAQSAGYTRRVLAPVQQVTGERTAGVQAGAVQRAYSSLAQGQLLRERAGAAYAETIAESAAALDRVQGVPGGASSIDAAVDLLSTRLEALVSDPASFAARQAVVDAGTALADRLNALSASVQDLRSSAEQRLGDAAVETTRLLGALADLNSRMVRLPGAPENPALADERDRLLQDLSRYLDLERTDRPDGTIVLRTGTGITLLDGSQASRLAFVARPSLSAAMELGAAIEPGRLEIVSPSGVAIDATENGLVRSGEIAALLEARDGTLVAAQQRLDQLAGGLARIVSEQVPAFSHDTGAGTLSVSWPMGVAGAPAAPAGQSIVLSFDLGGERRSVVAADPASLEAALQAAPINLAGASVGEDAATGTWTLSGLAGVSGVAVAWNAGATSTGTTMGLFVDRGGAGPITAASRGLAERIGFSPAAAQDPALIVRGGANALAAGDPRRVEALSQALKEGVFSFAADPALGGGAISTTIPDYARRIVAATGAAKEQAGRIAEGQAIALAAVEARFAENAAVDIDEEMAQLVRYQTAYTANARVLTAVRELLDVLMRV